MNRSRRHHSNPHSRRIVISFIVGVIVGLLPFMFSRFFAPRHKPAPYAAARAPAAYPGPAAPQHKKIRVAIVLDDFGYNYNNVEAVFGIGRPVTFSILPHLEHSQAIAERITQKGYEAILHVPLEPQENERSVKPERNTIMVRMNEQQIIDILSGDIENLKSVRGVSNHQGSRATEDKPLMRVIMAQLKKRDLFFLDSLVTHTSICRQAAKEMGVRFRRRDIFLDNEEGFEYIKGQMQQLIRRAKRSGSAVGIGHDRAKTVEALSLLMPEAEKQGVQFVFLSELM